MDSMSKRSFINKVVATYRTFIILKSISLLEKEGGEPRYNEIAIKLLEQEEWMSPATLSKYLKKLARDGLVTTRVIDERRGYVVYNLSDKGIEKLSQMADALLKYTDELKNRVSVGLVVNRIALKDTAKKHLTEYLKIIENRAKNHI